jgi:hypothetical protein
VEERGAVLANGPPAISQAELECLFFSAICELASTPSLTTLTDHKLADLPTRPSRPVAIRPISNFKHATMKPVTSDNHPLSVVVHTTPTSQQSVTTTGITKPMPPPFLPSGVCTKDALFMVSLSWCQESPTSTEHELSPMYSPIPLALQKLRDEDYHNHAPVPLGLDARPTLQFTVKAGDTHTLVNILHLGWVTEYPVGTKRQPALLLPFYI